ncbi:WD40 repeat domain-containing protein [Micromonospora sp. NBC_01796]|uniref:WD40 repeat domain-containing protein n=1 Tax=Micromonospora sp. NBC_01796 TaxID=2975987 RepID=UPI002DDBEC55|nr:hypothetical protein [Micromonospora sp. NBC_01796]WSA85918.1 hypothetical protein OIE47_37195 [Micromonospora sp. NBC_01796]
MTESPLTDVLARIADQARPARIPPDTWRKGIRRRRIRLAGGVLTVAVALAGGFLLFGHQGGQGIAPADAPRPVVPSDVYSPLTGEDTIVEAPPGPAAILVAGDHELRGSDIWGWEGRSLLVGQNGSYRLARTVGETNAGAGGLLLSPDGRYLASQPWIEGSQWAQDQTAVVDLVTGEVVQYDGGFPMGWTPDSRSILLHSPPLVSYQVGDLRLLSLETGQARPLPEVEGRMRIGNFAAFSPDGARIAVATEDALSVIDVAGNSVRKLVDLTARDRLAGPGAWLPDGKRIATYTVGGCEEGETCDERSLAQRLFQVRYVDADSGQPADGPRLAPARGLAARMLGWQRDDAAVVAVYAPEKGAVKGPNDPNWSETDWWTVGGVDLRTFRADGSQRRLVDLPGSALFVDVPVNLLDRFGGPSPTPLEGAARWLLALYWPLGQVVELLIVIVISVVILAIRGSAKRRVRAPTEPPFAPGTASSTDGRPSD